MKSKLGTRLFSKALRSKTKDSRRMICLTGGPGAGKTAITEVIRREFKEDILPVLPESASIIYAHIARPESAEGKKIIQKAIYQLQSCSEELARAVHLKALGWICDRGTLDGAAYFPDGAQAFFKTLKTNLTAELSRYDVVIHLESPDSNTGYNNDNPLRVEDAHQARVLDQKLQEIWKKHPKRFFIKSRNSFVEKVDEVMTILRAEIKGIS